MLKMILKILKDKKGQGLVEYTLIVAFVAIGIIASLEEIKIVYDQSESFIHTAIYYLSHKP